jgi:gamma-glutamylcysteine synthetase
LLSSFASKVADPEPADEVTVRVCKFTGLLSNGVDPTGKYPSAKWNHYDVKKMPDGRVSALAQYVINRYFGKAKQDIMYAWLKEKPENQVLFDEKKADAIQKLKEDNIASLLRDI